MISLYAKRDDGAILVTDQPDPTIFTKAVLISSHGAWLTTIGVATNRGQWSFESGPVGDPDLKTARRLLAIAG